MGGHKDKSGNSAIPVPPPPPPYPGHSNGHNDNKNYAPPTYAYSSMHSNPYGAHAAHLPARFPAEIKPGVFNIWGIQGYTGSVSTETNLNPEETYCNLAKIQQSMTGHNQFDPSKFSNAAAEPKLEVEVKAEDDAFGSDDSDSDNDNLAKLPRPPTPGSNSYHQDQFTFSTHYSAHPKHGNSYTYGLPPPPCPSTKKVEKKDTKKRENKCHSCGGQSGHPVKKIKKVDGEPIMCWACVWRTYMHAAQQIWEESEEVKSGDE